MTRDGAVPGSRCRAELAVTAPVGRLLLSALRAYGRDGAAPISRRRAELVRTAPVGRLPPTGVPVNG